VTEPGPAERLQDLILSRLHELGDKTGPMSAREAARRADGLVSYETLRNLARGVRHRGGISDRVAEGLARALQVPTARVYEAAGVPSPGERWQWPRRFDRLNPSQRALVEDVAAAILEAEERGRRQGG
jgi:hypothetical protein